jgi:hypothetical protein
MCVPYRGMGAELSATLDRISLIFTFYFSSEALLKMVVYGKGDLVRGWHEYWSYREDHNWCATPARPPSTACHLGHPPCCLPLRAHRNRLDFSVTALDVVLLLVQLFASFFDSHGATSLRMLRVFRALRVLRAFKFSTM